MTEDKENRTRVTILTSTYRVNGYIELIPGARVTDYINDAKNFIAITDAEVRGQEGRMVLQVPFLNLSRDQIVIVTPGDA
ncbi:MAG TPA: hypothetical protein VFO86_12035 [Terriglobia bacterium]|nr:hypothetical protein [Terriglobia bacterium]